MGPVLDFTVPQGGMVVWTRFNLDLPELDRDLLAHGLYINSDREFMERFNSARMGFASMEEEEIRESLGILGERLASFKKT